MNLVYGLSLHEFSVAQVDRALAYSLGGYKVRILSGTQIFSLSHVHDMLINSLSQFLFPSPRKCVPNECYQKWCSSLFTLGLDFFGP